MGGGGGFSQRGFKHYVGGGFMNCGQVEVDYVMTSTFGVQPHEDTEVWNKR